jgi:hypothetical protein
MKSSARLGLGLVVIGSLFAFAGCGDDDDSGPNGGGGTAAHGGSAAAGEATASGGGGASTSVFECEVLGELCHEADTGSGPAHDCHETGHVAHPDACAEQFDGCIATCVTDDAGAGGAAGGEQDSHCAALGELCHPVDDMDGPLHDCHELGHVGNAVTCAAAFDDCAVRCLAAREELEAEEAGGAGGLGSGGVSGVGGAPAGGAGGAR